MSGLDNLLNQIRNTAEEEANARLNQARQQAEELIQNKKDLAEKEIENIKLKTDRKALEILEKAKSAAALQKRNAVLSAKQQIIESLLKTTLDKLNNLEDEAYFQIIRKMVSRYALSQDGQIIFSEKDKNRFPAVCTRFHRCKDRKPRNLFQVFPKRLFPKACRERRSLCRIKSRQWQAR